MVLKIFTKRRPGGKLLTTDENWHNKFVDGEEITAKVVNSFAFISSFSGETKYEHVVDLTTHGYEILTNNGVVVEKYVTTINLEE